MRVCKTCHGRGIARYKSACGTIESVFPCFDCDGRTISHEELYELAFIDGYEVAEAKSEADNDWSGIDRTIAPPILPTIIAQGFPTEKEIRDMMKRELTQ